jgi:hypothetical protein
MPNFDNLFSKEKTRPIRYHSLSLYRQDEWEARDGNRFVLEIESTNSEWRQGIGLDVDGHFLVAGQRIPKKIALWEDTAPRLTRFEVECKSCLLRVKNLWDTGNGVTQAWHNGAAMIIEDAPNGKRYRCNDGHPDDDFDDIIFRIERIS